MPEGIPPPTQSVVSKCALFPREGGWGNLRRGFPISTGKLLTLIISNIPVASATLFTSSPVRIIRFIPLSCCGTKYIAQKTLQLCGLHCCNKRYHFLQNSAFSDQPVRPGLSLLYFIACCLFLHPMQHLRCHLPCIFHMDLFLIIVVNWKNHQAAE